MECDGLQKRTAPELGEVCLPMFLLNVVVHIDLDLDRDMKSPSENSARQNLNKL